MGVDPKNFTQGELKRSYENLAKIYHPDKNPEPEAAEKFRQVILGNINHFHILLHIVTFHSPYLAYDVLGSNEKRNAYDVFRQTDFSQEEKLLDQLKWQFKNETLRAEQFRLY